VRVQPTASFIPSPAHIAVETHLQNLFRISQCFNFHSSPSEVCPVLCEAMIWCNLNFCVVGTTPASGSDQVSRLSQSLKRTSLKKFNLNTVCSFGNFVLFKKK